MNVSDFNVPTQHPYGMLENYSQANKKESVLAIVLVKCIEAGAFVPVTLLHNHQTMVEDGLLTLQENGDYSLTKKSIGLLYSVYRKG